MALGAIASSPLAGFASACFGGRALLRLAAPAAAMAFAGITPAPSRLTLAGALALMGAALPPEVILQNRRAS